MLDKIQSTLSDSINQSQNLDRIQEIGITNPIDENSGAFFIDESQISNAAIEKYQHDLDVKNFSEILKETDEQAANELVIQQAFDGIFSVDDTDFLSELLSSEDFLNDIA